MPQISCAVCGRIAFAKGRGTICPDPECRRARRRAYDAGLGGQVGLPTPQAQCEICGASFPAKVGRKTCSPECRRERQRQRWREQYHALPDAKKRELLKQRQERKAADPAWGQAIDRRKWQRTKADPERLARARAKARDHYARHAEAIQARRRERLQSLSAEELGRLYERSRCYTREWRRREARDPVRAKLRQEYRREYLRRRRDAETIGDTTTLAALLAGRQLGRQAPPCEICGKPIIGRHPTAKTCSNECQYKRWLIRNRPATQKICPVCGASFAPKTAALTCSAKCRRARRNEQKQKGRKNVRES